MTAGGKPCLFFCWQVVFEVIEIILQVATFQDASLSLHIQYLLPITVLVAINMMATPFVYCLPQFSLTGMVEVMMLY